MPWLGIDPIVISAEIINNLQTIVSRDVEHCRKPGSGYHRGNKKAAIAATSSPIR